MDSSASNFEVSSSSNREGIKTGTFMGLCPELFKLIGSVKNLSMDGITLEEVLDGLKQYIFQKKLFDPNYPMKILCSDDELGKIFGLKEFTIIEVRKLLENRKLVFPLSVCGGKDSADVTPCICICDRASKRKLEEESDNQTLAKKKMIECQAESCFACSKKKGICILGNPNKASNRPNRSPMLLHIPPSPTRYGSTSDTAESVQGYETAFAKDSSDEDAALFLFDDNSSDNFLPPLCGVGALSGDIFTIAETFDLEYEVETDDSIDDYSDFSTCSDSDSEFYALGADITVICKTDSDQEFFADESSEENGFDAEIPKSDRWFCDTCGSFNDPPMRCCLRCWQVRTGWLPPNDRRNDRSPPKRKKPRSKRNKNSDTQKNKDNFPIKQESLSQNSQTFDLPSTSSKESQKSTSHEEIKLVSETQTSNKKHDSLSSDIKLCLLCCSKPVDASIIHGRFAHSISCYRCARKLQQNKKRCPICRRIIEKVVYQISSI